MVGNNTVARTPFHNFDFRGCDGAVQDEHTWRKAYPVGAPTCTDEGIKFEGTSSQYVNLDNFYFGGATSIEMYAKHDAYNYDSQLFYAADDTSFTDAVAVKNDDALSSIQFQVWQGSTAKRLNAGDFSNTEWTHVVVTVEGKTMNLYENGVLVGSKRDAWEPTWKQRQFHRLGANSFNGTIAYFRMWKHTAYGTEPILSREEIDAMYNDVNAKTSMLDIKRLSVTVRCEEGDGDCVLDGEKRNRVRTRRWMDGLFTRANPPPPPHPSSCRSRARWRTSSSSWACGWRTASRSTAAALCTPRAGLW
jgi:hypothetical protein